MTTPSVHDLWVAVYERPRLTDDGRWRAYSVATLCLALGTGSLGRGPESLTRRALAAWQTSDGDSQLEAFRVELWAYLDAKHGNSTTIADAEDRAARTAIGGMFATGTREEAHEGAEWYDTWHGDGWLTDGWVREVLNLLDDPLRRVLSEQFALLGESTTPGA